MRVGAAWGDKRLRMPFSRLGCAARNIPRGRQRNLVYLFKWWAVILCGAAVDGRLIGEKA